MAKTEINMSEFVAFAKDKGHTEEQLGTDMDLVLKLRAEFLESKGQETGETETESAPSTRYLVNKGYGKVYVYSWTSKRGRGGSECPFEGAVLQSQAPGISSHTFVVSGKTGDIRVNGMTPKELLKLLGAGDAPIKDVNPED